MHKNFPVIISLVIVIASAGLAYVVWRQQAPTKPAQEDTSAIVLPTPPPSPSPSPVTPEPETITSPLPTPTPPPPLDDSDAFVKADIARLDAAAEIMAMLTDEEILRKIVRAVHGLSEGRVVREFRPVVSPQGSLLVQPTNQRNAEDQNLYRISRDNDARYAPYIALFSSVNNDALIALYRFYLPTLDDAYQELGLTEGDFHSTLLKATDVLLSAPEQEEALMLTRSIMYEYDDPAIEALPSAHKLMLRMGGANREALKLELKSFRERLSAVK